jgi:sugar lactone lactonase YvrE
MRRIYLFVLALSLVLGGYLLLWPVPIEPQSWTPPPAPELAGPLAPNDKLANIQRWAVGDAKGPEAVAVDAQGRVYTGVEDGRILRFSQDGKQREVFARIAGRPLGMQFDRQGNLIVCANSLGLLSLDLQGAATVLAESVNGVRFKSLNELDIDAEGVIYFTETSTRWPIEQFRHVLFEHKPDGRLLSFNPRSKETKIVLEGLYFANGVAISSDQAFVLVAETGAYRLRRVWLKGERAGQTDFFAENLPGFPDNLSATSDGRFWVAFPTPRNKLLDMILPYPFWRKAIFRLPEAMQPAPTRYGFIVSYDRNGGLAANFQDPQGRFEQITGVWEQQGRLYLSSLTENAVGVYEF